MVIRRYNSVSDLELVIKMHGDEYEEEFNWNRSFEIYVQQSLQVLKEDGHPHILWIAEEKNEFAGCAGVVIHDNHSAQFRWFLVTRRFRGRKLGAALLQMAIDFSKFSGSEVLYLWTVDELYDAAHLYRSFKFSLTEEKFSGGWGLPVKEQKYTLHLC